MSAPQPKQKVFFNAHARYIAYGGARGGGKSWALRHKLVLLCMLNPGISCLLLRKTLPELRENHLLPLLSMLHGIATYKKDERAFSFPNGARLRLGYCDRENHIYQYQGQEYDVIGVEECTHFTFAQIQFLTTCNRPSEGNKNDFMPRMIFTGNPGGVGHKWFKRWFVDKQYTADENPADFVFIPATVEDNPILMRKDPHYVKKLDALPEKLKKAHRYGDFHIFDGQFFEEFRDDPAHYNDGFYTHVIAPFDIDPNWRIYRSFDFGYAKPFSCAWWAQDFDGRLFRILELYGCTNEPNTGVKWPPEQIFAEIRQIETTHKWLKGKTIAGVADPSIWDASRGESIAETAARQRVYFDKGDNARLPGWMQVHYRLMFDEEGRAMMYFFSTCKAIIRTLPLLQFSSSRPEDLDTGAEDHCADEMRYLCMANPIPPRMAIQKIPPQGFDPLRRNG